LYWWFCAIKGRTVHHYEQHCTRNTCVRSCSNNFRPYVWYFNCAPIPSFNVIKNNTIINNVGTTQTIVPFLSGTTFTVKSFGAQVVTDLIINNFAYGNGTVTNRGCNYKVAPYAIGSFPVTCGNIGNVVPITSAQTAGVLIYDFSARNTLQKVATQFVEKQVSLTQWMKGKKFTITFN